LTFDFLLPYYWSNLISILLVLDNESELW
jgi:hypothetical protein